MNVLVISVHPDDETLGCGGTLLRHKHQGDKVHWLIVTQAYEPQWSTDVLRKKADEVKRVAAAYGMEEVLKLGLPTVKLDMVAQQEIIEPVRNLVARVNPEVVYLVHDGDVHSDHHAVFTASMAAMKPFHMQALGVRRILSFETLSSTDASPPQPQRAFLPQVFHDISPYLERKLQIMRLYSTESQKEPFPRAESSIRALARYRGAIIGVQYAEAFVLMREIV